MLISKRSSKIVSHNNAFRSKNDNVNTFYHYLSSRLNASPKSSTVINILSRRNIVKFATGSILVLPLLGEIYARSGSPNMTGILSSLFEPDKLESWRSAQSITLVYHGAGGQDVNTDALINTLKNSSQANHLVKMIDWSEDSQDTLKASFSGSKIGRAIACKLSEVVDASDSGPLISVHLIGISVGAFAANSCVQELDRKLSEQGNRANVNVQLTLLDPFSQRGVLGIGYGNSEFGKGANYAQQYLNTDDPVPSTNSALKYCAVTDVTDIRPQNIFGHDWPLIYYTKSLDKSSNSMIPQDQRRPRGSIISI